MDNTLMYRIESEGNNIYYTSDKKEAMATYRSYVEQYGHAKLCELEEEWDKEEQDWEIVSENIIEITPEN